MRCEQQISFQTEQATETCSPSPIRRL